ncbi:MAG: hypothetical protein ABFD29_03940 [Anaerolineaceae bacterium]
MNWTRWLSHVLIRQLPPQKLVDLAVEAWPQMWQRVPQEQRIDFLKDIAEKNMGTFLADMDRKERGALMNALLPLVAREFPLIDLDFMTAFPSPSEDHQGKDSA